MNGKIVNSKDRLAWVDTAKGVGIILMIIGHLVPSGTFLHRWIYSFHMPLFFILSGFVFNWERYRNVSYRPFLRKKSKQLLLPYLKTAIWCFVIFGLISGFLMFGFTEQFLDLVTKYIVGILVSRGKAEWMPGCTPLWFLVALFFAEILFFLLMKFKRMYLLAVLIPVGFVISKSNDFFLWNTDIAAFALGFLSFGFCLRKYDLLLRQPFIVSMLAIVLGIGAFSVNGAVSLNSRTLSNPLLTYVTAISFSYLLIQFSRKIPDMPLILYLGANTLVVLGFNKALNSLYHEWGANLVGLFCHILSKFIGGFSYHWSMAIVFVVAGSLFLIWFNQLLKRTKFKAISI